MATTPKTVRTYALNGSLTTFTIPFEYLARKFVVVTLIGTTRRELILNTEYRFATATQITTTKAWGPADGFDLIEIRRLTSATDRLVDFADGSILRAYDLNISSVQSLHIAEEARDLTADTIGVNNDGDLDARARKIVNVADGVNPGDAVNMRQQQTWADTALNHSIAAAESAQASAAQAALALTRANAASTSAGNAQTSASNAQGSATAASTSAGQAQTSNTQAATQAAAALVSANTAKDWASLPEDQVVTGGLYSSFHYSRKAAAQVPLAAAQVALAVNQVTLATTQATNATTEANRSKTEADRAQGYANGLNFPPASGNAGLVLAQNITATGFEYKAIPQRNLLINPSFQIWQRALAFTNLVGYGSDRWRVSTVGSGGTYYTIAQTVGSRRAHRMSITALGSISQLIMEQRIETVQCVADAAYVTVSFRLSSNVGGGNVNVSLVQNFGSGGSAEVITTATAKAITGPNTYNRYEFTIKLPTTVGKTIAANGSYLSARIHFAGFIANQWFDVQDVKAEEGFRATPFEFPKEVDEMVKCWRYYWRINPIDWNFQSYTVGGIASRYTQLPVIPRGGAVLRTNANTPASSGGVDLNRLSVALSGSQQEIRWIVYSSIAADSCYIGFNTNNYVEVEAEL